MSNAERTCSSICDTRGGNLRSEKPNTVNPHRGRNIQGLFLLRSFIQVLFYCAVPRSTNINCNQIYHYHLKVVRFI
uniref:Uncharacterized protein n=1 Tax=Trichogramma kaykai TaxID=54128 RepID=A0ABD2WUS9_9HYME